jgi:hypothetical protein
MQAKRLGFDPVVHPDDKTRGGIPAVAALLQPFFKRYSETAKKPPAV